MVACTDVSRKDSIPERMYVRMHRCVYQPATTHAFPLIYDFAF